MELISQRVARGLEVRPSKRRHSPSPSDPDVLRSLAESSSKRASPSSWEKVGERAANARDYVGNLKETFKGDNVCDHHTLEKASAYNPSDSGRTRNIGVQSTHCRHLRQSPSRTKACNLALIRDVSSLFLVAY